MINGGSILGRVLPNLLAEQVGLLNVIAPVTLICGGLVFAVFALTNVPGVVIFSLLYGFFSGGCKIRSGN